MRIPVKVHRRIEKFSERTLMFEETITLNIANITSVTRALGPGLRATVWVQGWLFGCPGCISPAWAKEEPAQLLRSDTIVEMMLSHPEVCGFTFSGGEPMLQAAGLAQVIRTARKQKDLTLICFTGYKHDQLHRPPYLPGVNELLAETDVLIDGPYMESLNNNIGLRGSSNQQIHYLTDRLRFFDFENCSRRVEIDIENDFISLTGIPSAATLKGYESAIKLDRFP
jgi:anaerobic ribonucleoside-triphosphate reductase activating protein